MNEINTLLDVFFEREREREIANEKRVNNAWFKSDPRSEKRKCEEKRMMWGLWAGDIKSEEFPQYKV